MSSRDEAASARKRKSRGKGLRVRTGCLRCKSRHVKCSEERPSCHACQKVGHDCEYPNRLPSEDGEQDRQCLQASQARVDQGVEDVQAGLDLDFASAGPLMRDRNTSLTQGSQYNDAQSQADASNPFSDDALFSAAVFETSPGSAWSGWADVSAEAAPLKWFGLVATDASHQQDYGLHKTLQSLATPVPPQELLDANQAEVEDIATHDPPGSLVAQSARYCSQDDISLSPREARFLQHFVLGISGWIDVTDPDHAFAVIVSQMGLRNSGVMNAILALSARHLSIIMTAGRDDETAQSNKTAALHYYHRTLGYLQQEMRKISFLTSDELLATVLLISTYEMIDGSGRGWERHLKGVFWIQRSQLIHGESEGLKQRIWWAWLRQDIWVAYREQRKILSYYNVTRDVSSLGFWELVDRAVWLLGQCVNYASLQEQRAGQTHVQSRIDQSSSLWTRLEAWAACFAKFDRRLPIAEVEDSAFKPIWISPPAAALALQVHHFSKVLLLEHTPATGGLKELSGRQTGLQASVSIICGIACSIFDEGALILSTMCLYGAGLHANTQAEQDHVVKLMHAHHSRTGWPHYDIANDLRRHWTGNSD